MYRVRTTFSGLSGAPYLNTLYFRDTAGTAQQAADAAHTFWNSVRVVMSNALVIQVEQEVATVDETTGDATTATGTTTTTMSGTDTAVALPRSSQALVRWLTGFYVGGRQIRGRTFVPGLTGGSLISGGLVTPSTSGIIDSAADALIAETNATLVVYSPARAGDYDVGSGSTWSEFAVLRSRRD